MKINYCSIPFCKNQAFPGTKLCTTCSSQVRNSITRADRIISEILDHGLAQSTWREKHGDAYLELLQHREDMVDSAKKVLNQRKPPKPQKPLKYRIGKGKWITLEYCKHGKIAKSCRACQIERAGIEGRKLGPFR